MTLQSNGILVYHSRWVILECPTDLLTYYWNWVYRETHVKLHKPRFGSHISVIRGNEVCDRTSDVYRKHHEKTLTFSYANDLQTNGDYWWLPVSCPILEAIRDELGLSPIPEFGFHLTIGREKTNS